MPLFDITHVALERALSGASLRQKAIAENLANANTPGYRRQDVDFHGALQRAMGSGREAVERTGFSVEADPASPVRADGGSVDVDVETTALAQNGLEYEAIASIIKTQDSILRTAIGSR
jgi:flagellar basal-body rod protein FlgB